MEGSCWNPVKSARLKRVRGVSFEELLEHGRFIEVRQHPTHALQSITLFEYQGYVWVVPYVIDGERRFLKTLYPSRKYTRLFLKGGRDEA